MDDHRNVQGQTDRFRKRQVLVMIVYIKTGVKFSRFEAESWEAARSDYRIWAFKYNTDISNPPEFLKSYFDNVD